MAADPLEYPDTKTFGDLVVEIGNGASPEVFSAPCGFNTKAFNRSTTTSTATIPACNDPDAPGQQVTAVTGRANQVTGAGVLAAENLEMWSSYLEGGPKNVRVHIVGLEYHVGLAVLTQLNITGSKGQEADILQVSVTLDGAAAWTRTQGDPAS